MSRIGFEVDLVKVELDDEFVAVTVELDDGDDELDDGEVVTFVAGVTVNSLAVPSSFSPTRVRYSESTSNGVSGAAHFDDRFVSNSTRATAYNRSKR